MTSQRTISISTSSSSSTRSPSSPTATSLAFLVIAAWPLACGLGVPGNGQRTMEDRAATSFSRLDSESSLDVQATRGDTFSVTVSIDSNLQRYVTTRVSGDTLLVDVDHAVDDTVAGPHVIVTMPRLDQAILGGSGRLVLAFQQDQPIELDLDGSGDLTFDGGAPRLTARLDGSGDMRIDGSADAVDLRLDGSGRMNARGCTATSADVSLGGSGDIAATVTGATRASLSGSGNIDLYGGGALESTSVSGSGAIRRH